jgi:hypothetical protein
VVAQGASLEGQSSAAMMVRCWCRRDPKPKIMQHGRRNPSFMSDSEVVIKW